MKLELKRIFTKDIRFDDKIHVKDDVLHVSRKEIETLVLEDNKLAGCHVDIARPDESVKITPVKDVIEPRVKISGGGEIFPGVVGKISPQVDTGRTHALEGCCIITTSRIVGFQEGVIGMNGPAADYCPFSKTNDLRLVVEPADGLETHVYEKAARMARLRVTAYLGETAKDLEPDRTVTYETKPIFGRATMYPDLPRVGYIHMLQSQGPLHDTYYYGADAKQFVPTFIYPTEIMDGAVVSGNCVAPYDKVTIYHHFHNSMIKDCFRHYGRNISFMGVILTNKNVFLADKGRHSDVVAKLYSWMGSDGVLITEEGYGSPDTDLMMDYHKVENARTKAVLIIDEFPDKDGKSQLLADACREADVLASCGQGNATLISPAMDEVIGTQKFIEMQIKGWDEYKNPDGNSEAEFQIIIASTIANGFNKLVARGY